MKRRATSRRAPAADLATVLRRDPKLIRVLHAHGVQVCAGCCLTLTSPVEKAAAYHGVPDVPAFLRALRLPPPARAARRKHRGRR
jgi:hypothetical protein